ncbi:MAG: efflux RND transporter permease subunit, partial [Anaerovoracaceae bacterium]|nr:efflux RND transporter permease subunit [Anaerovoracaceae bacterium]
DYADRNLEIADKIEKILKEKNLDSYTVQSSNIDTSQLFGRGLEVNIFGEDDDKLLDISKDVMKMAKDLKGFEKITNGQDSSEKEIVLDINKKKAAREGLTVAQVYSALQKKLTTDKKATSIDVNGSIIDVDLVDERNMLTKRNLLDFEIEADNSGQNGAASGSGSSGNYSSSGSDSNDSASNEKKTVRLGDIAKISFKDSITDISHDNGSRVIKVNATTKEGYNTTLLSRKLEKKIKDYKAPDGYKLEIAGEVESVNTMVHDMLMMIFVAIILVYLIMVAQFANFLSPFIVMFTIPLAFTGGFLALMITEHEISIIALMGFLVLSGIVVNNGIVFIDYTNKLRRGGMEKRRALIETGKTRMRPILMTSLTTILAMSVMAVSNGQGAEMGQDMAIVTIGGLLYATLMTLFIVPVMYDIIYRKKELKVVDLGDESTLDFDEKELVSKEFI